MYLMGFVNSAFETRRPTGNLELVDLSLGNKYHPPELRKEHSNGDSQSCRMSNGNGTHMTMEKMENGSNNNSNGATLKTKAIASKPSRRTSVEDLPADLYMEPMSPVLSRSSDEVRHRSSWVPEETPVNWLKEDLASGRQELEQEWWSFCIGKASKQTTWKKPTSRWTSTFESVFADGGISIRVQHHPLETSTTEEDEDRDSDASEESRTGDTIAGSSDLELCEKIAEDANVKAPADEGLGLLQHLESVEKGELRKLLSTKTEANSAISSPELGIEQPEANGAISSPELGIEQPEANGAISSQELGIEQPGLQNSKGVPIEAPRRSSKLGGGNAEPYADLAKLPSSKTEANGAISSQELGIEQPKLQNSKAVPIAAPPRSSKLGGGNAGPHADLAKQPSLSTPVMEKMEAVSASLESPYSWKKEQLAKSGLRRELPVREQRELRYPAPKMDDLVQEELSFRVWERQASPKRRESRDEQDGGDGCARNGLPTLKDGEDDETIKKLSPHNVDALLNLRTLDLRSRRGGPTTTPLKVEVDSEQDYPSPSSFTCGLSPTSLFSDDQEPFRMSVSSSDDNMFPTFQPFRRSGVEEIRNGSFRKSPRSVLSQEPDETSHGTSDSSATSGKKHHRKQQTSSFKYLYNDESSDLESPMQCKFKHQLQPPFPAFTYSVGKDMGETSSSSSDEDEGEDVVAGSLQELGFFQEANYKEPWLVNDGGVLDDLEDLEFLWFPDSKSKDMTKSVAETSPLKNPQLRNGLRTVIQSSASKEMSETADGMTKHESPKTKYDDPKTKHESPKTKHDSPKTKHDSPKIKHDSPKTKHDSPKIKHDSPKAKHESPKAKHESPKTKHESPETKHESPKAKHESPKAKHESPKAKHESPKAKHDSPKTKHECPETKHESPKIKHDSLRRSTSEKKWVPYVTGSLHDDDPSRVRNPIRGGSRPQNPSFDKTTRGGKSSATNPSTEKAPKRSVNFAPDLVKEIPHSTTTTPTPAAAAAAAAAPDRKQQPRATPTFVKKEDAEPAVATKVKSKPLGEEDEEEGPSIMTSRRRWGRNRDVDSDSKSPGASTSFSRTRERVAQAMPSCAGRLFSWPRRLAGKVKSSRNVDSDDDGSFVGDRSFGNSARRDAELVRRILKGSQKKYSNLTGDDILKENFG